MKDEHRTDRDFWFSAATERPMAVRLAALLVEMELRAIERALRLEGIPEQERRDLALRSASRDFAPLIEHYLPEAGQLSFLHEALEELALEEEDDAESTEGPEPAPGEP